MADDKARLNLKGEPFGSHESKKDIQEDPYQKAKYPDYFYEMVNLNNADANNGADIDYFEVVPSPTINVKRGNGLRDSIKKYSHGYLSDKTSDIREKILKEESVRIEGTNRRPTSLRFNGTTYTGTEFIVSNEPVKNKIQSMDLNKDFLKVVSKCVSYYELNHFLVNGKNGEKLFKSGFKIPFLNKIFFLTFENGNYKLFYDEVDRSYSYEPIFFGNDHFVDRSLIMKFCQYEQGMAANGGIRVFLYDIIDATITKMNRRANNPLTIGFTCKQVSAKHLVRGEITPTEIPLSEEPVIFKAHAMSPSAFVLKKELLDYLTTIDLSKYFKFYNGKPIKFKTVDGCIKEGIIIDCNIKHSSNIFKVLDLESSNETLIYKKQILK